MSFKYKGLRGLSVFGDNTVPSKLDLFAFAGLHEYFGQRTAQGIRVAQVYRCPDGTMAVDKDRCPPELGDVGGGSQSGGFGFGVGTGGTAGGTAGS